MVSLGLDASTSVVGYAFTENKVILSAGFIDISEIKGNRDKAWFVVDHLKKDILLPKSEQINIEASLGGFSGPSSRKVIVMLARWNAILEYVLVDALKKPINLVNVSSARKQVFGKAREKDVKPKIFVKREIDKLYDMTPWLVYNKVKNVDKKCEDMYDAVVISLYNPSV